MFSNITFHLETVTTNMTFTNKSSACFAGAFVILASSRSICNSFDTALPEMSFPYTKKPYRLSCKCHVCGNSFKMKC